MSWPKDACINQIGRILMLRSIQIFSFALATIITVVVESHSFGAVPTDNVGIVSSSTECLSIIDVASNQLVSGLIAASDALMKSYSRLYATAEDIHARTNKSSVRQSTASCSGVGAVNLPALSTTLTPLPANGDFKLSASETTEIIGIPTPEPNSMVLLFYGMAALFLPRRRRK